MTSRVNLNQFGSLFHGTNVPGLSEINQSEGKIINSGMPRIHGWNFATTGLDTAIEYARTAAHISRTRRREHTPAVVYEVTPKRKSETWGPDPDSGPGGWNDGPRNKREAMDIHEGGGEVSLRFSSPLKALREVFVEDKAYDETPNSRWGRSFT